MVITQPPEKAEHITPIASVGNVFDVAKKATLSLPHNPIHPFRAMLGMLKVKLSSISAATKVTMKCTFDAGGDDVLLPDTEATISQGVTTANKGSAVYSVDIPVVFTATSLYVMCKTDAGTVTIDHVELTWRY